MKRGLLWWVKIGRLSVSKRSLYGQSPLSYGVMCLHLQTKARTWDLLDESILPADFKQKETKVMGEDCILMINPGQ